MTKRFMAIIEAKRPADATYEKVLEQRTSLTLAEIAKLWRLTPQRVWALEQRATRLADEFPLCLDTSSLRGT